MPASTGGSTPKFVVEVPRASPATAEDQPGLLRPNWEDGGSGRLRLQLPQRDADERCDDVRPGSPVAHRAHRKRVTIAPVPLPPPEVAGERRKLDDSNGARSVKTSSPITIFGVEADLRRKRIKKVSHYLLGSLLGEGAYGVVRDALNVNGDEVQRCAVKIMSVSIGVVERRGTSNPTLKRTTSAGSSAAAATFRNEVNNLQRFHCPYVLRAVDVFSRHGKEYLVLPIALCSVEQLLRHGEERAAARNAAGPSPMAEGSQATTDSDDGDVDLHSVGSSSTVSTTQTVDSYGDDRHPHRRRRGTGSPGGALSAASSTTSTPQFVVANLPSKSLPYLALPPSSAGDIAPTGLSSLLVRGILYQVLMGVAYLHQQGLAHHDIKPSNLLVFEDGTVKLGDLGSVGSMYRDQGTPLFASPELCRVFYRMNDEEVNEKSVDAEPELDAAEALLLSQQHDLWCCGLTLYRLLTGKPGPLDVHISFQRQWSHLDYHPRTSDGQDGGGEENYATTRFQFYRQLASHDGTLKLDDVPDWILPCTGAGEPQGKQDPDNGFPVNGVRHLLSQLLHFDPKKRFTAEQALRHPWLSLPLRRESRHHRKHPPHHVDPSDGAMGVSPPMLWTNNEAASQPKQVAHAINQYVAQQVVESSAIKKMVLRDRQRHLQFVADCCQVLGIELPPEIIRPLGNEPFEQDDPYRQQFCRGSQLRTNTAATPQRRMFGHPKRMPVGCVDPDLFLTRDEDSYYQHKSGKMEFDVCHLQEFPRKVKQLEAYLHNVVLIKCGYRTKADPRYVAVGPPSVLPAPSVAANGARGGSPPPLNPVTPARPSVSTNLRTSTSQMRISQPMADAIPATGTVVMDDDDDEDLDSQENSHNVSVAASRDQAQPRGGSPTQTSTASQRASTQRTPTTSHSANRSTNGSTRERRRQAAPADEHSEMMKESSKCLCGLV